MLIDLPAGEIGEALELDGEDGGRLVDGEALQGTDQLAAVAALAGTGYEKGEIRR